VLDETDTLLDGVTVRTLRAGATHHQKRDADLPVSAAGQFVIGVLDATDTIAEIDEDTT
jgi:hypothetical protein